MSGIGLQSVRRLGVGALGLLAVTVPSARASAQEWSAPRAEVRLAFMNGRIKKAWDEGKVRPSRQASDEEFLRRVYLDTLGRIPTVQEAQAFLGAREQGKRQKLVEYLLNHPDFAKNFATQWTVLLL